MSYKSGYGFPKSIYEDVARMRSIFDRKWFFIGMRADVPKPRDFYEFEIFGERYFFVHGADGNIRCFVNRCPHQSARLVQQNTGKCAGRIVCPNHQWAYDINSGALVHAAGMPKGFPDCAEGRDIRLDEINVREVYGMVFVCLGTAPPAADIAAIERRIPAYVQPYEMGSDSYKPAEQARESVRTNWLTAMINSRECNHCAENHKRLLSIFHPESFSGTTSPSYEKALRDAENRWESSGLAWKEQPFSAQDNCRAARFPLANGAQSNTFDGKPACALPIGPHKDIGYDSSTLSVWVNPNAWVHISSDHIVANWVLPISKDETRYHTSWYVRADAKEGTDYCKDHLTEVWRVTNSEDTALCVSMHAGINSKYYRPGPFSNGEKFSRQFCDWYMTHSHSA